ncbi:MAG: 2-dehydro-3-deoxy-D-gluconate 5-dehydrogenase KduD [Candidatus Marinimicrobia bacterium]|nr:2-dehydro-3-deoxy-D-gluconate 5-dehydrogenase KduD [Candidatus Neomarinimicrobiota bacterium]MCF7827417.1 2-dehydro-3-deoxy-D-gluconate 5-dehydrogenase KduD [Candidatus Neomarinimicrobiota bacterium]MCF7881350.1 2-dehydro-3-deoxy-D-gluconate 5-dehydrogenase KduD [Candidatus Neomarinimicrobiota bacterium]
MLDKFSLDGKVAIVTGASRGLGEGMALGLAEAGADIVALARDTKKLENTAKKVKERGQKVLPMECDVTDLDRYKEVLQEAQNELGSVDILVNNAGIIRRAPAKDYPDDYWYDVIETNLNAVFMLSRETGKIMIDQDSGKIINIASLLSFTGGITVPSYSASKGGVMQVTKALANEWAQHNVQVNAIAPGYYETDNTAPLQEDENRYKAISERIPTGRWGQPEDLQGAVVFLASEASTYVNGHVLVVDGGWTAR